MRNADNGNHTLVYNQVFFISKQKNIRDLREIIYKLNSGYYELKIYLMMASLTFNFQHFIQHHR
jgi:hypothetical protein